MMFRKAALSAILLLLSISPSLAWDLDPHWRDPFSSLIGPAAVDTNDQGMTIAIFRSQDASVRALYSYPDNSFDMFPSGGLLLSVRGGDGMVSDADTTSYHGINERGPMSSGRSVSTLLWHGQDKAPVMGTLRDMLDGDAIHARFMTRTGGYVETSWDMAGGVEVIASAIDIDMTVPADYLAAQKAMNEFFIVESRRCGPETACFKEMAACLDSYIADDNFEAFALCTENLKP